MRKSVKALFAVLIVVVALAMALTACHGGKYKMQDFVVDFSELARTYEVGDTVDLSKVKMYATFSDGTQQDIPLDRVTIKVDGVQIGLNELSKITETTGTKIVEIKYSDVTRSVTIKVNEKHIAVLTGVEFDATNLATREYNVGDTNVSLAGLKVYAVYDEYDRQEIALNDQDLAFFMGEENITNNLARITAEVGNRAIKVRYKTITTSEFFTIVVNDVLDSVTVNVPANLKKDYKVGDAVNFDSITATANYRSGRKASDLEVKFYLGTDEIASLASLTETAGQKVVTAKAVSGEVEGSADITLNVANFVTGISLSLDGVQLEYVADDVISDEDFAGVKVNVTYADPTDNAQLTLTSDGVSCVNANDEAIIFENLTRTAGTKAITVKYAGKSDTFSVVVLAKVSALESFTVTAPPTKAAYTAGETGVSLAGLVVTGVYKDELAREDDEIAYADFATYGVTLFYNDNEVEDIDNLTKIAKLGANTVTVAVKYLGKTATFNLTVTNSVTALQILANPNKVAYKLHEDFSLAGLSVKAVKNFGEETLELDDLAIFDGTTDVTSNLNALTAAVADEKAVTVKFGGQEASFNISVADYITGLELQGTKEFECDVNVTAGSKFTNFAGLNVYAVYESGAKVLLESGYTFTGNEITVPSNGKNVTVHYQDFEIGGVTLVVKNVLNSITVDDNSIPTKTVKGSQVNLTGIKVYGDFVYGGHEQLINILQQDGTSFLYGVVGFELKDEHGEYQVLAQTDLDEIAREVGDSYVRLSYTYNGKTCKDEFVVTVIASGSISGFSLPTSLVNHNTTLANGRLYQDKEDTEQNANFEGSLYVGESEDYLVGDDNPYKFLPKATQIDIETSTVYELSFFKADSTIYLVDGADLIPLVATVTGAREKTWSYGGKNYVVENFVNNEYDFTDDAINKKFKLSVLPNEELAWDGNAVEWTVKVVDGYNIYDSREICLLEQPSQATRDLRTTKYPNGRTYWDSIKTELGLTGVRPTSIILHNSLQVTKTSLPQDFWFELDANYSITYKYGDNKYAPEDVPADLGGPLERAFLWDQEWGLLQYDMNKGESFAIHGNFFDIDLSKLPLVCSFEPDIEHPENRDAYYMDYMSKLSFIDIRGWDVRYTNGVNGPKLPLTNQGKKPTESAEQDEHFYFDNFMVKGNCSQTQLLLSKEGTTWTEGRGDNPVYGGGIIFVKTHYCHADVTNVNAHGCFISFFSRDYTVVNYTNCKSYDSYLNALYILGETDNTLTNCHFKRAGGPLMIVTQQTDDLDGDANENEYIAIPRLVANDNCVLENFVTGEEVWFDIFAPGQVTLLKPLDKLLNGYFTKTFLQGNSFNLIAVSSQGQCYVEYKGDKMDRLATDTVYQNASAFAANGSIVFSVGDTMCAVGQTSDKDYYLMNAARTELATAAASGDTTIATFSGDHPYITLHIGSGSSALGIFTGFMPYAG